MMPEKRHIVFANISMVRDHAGVHFITKRKRNVQSSMWLVDDVDIGHQIVCIMRCATRAQL